MAMSEGFARGGPPGRRARRVAMGILLTAALWLGVLGFANGLVRRHLALRFDGTEDQLTSVGGAAKTMLARLEAPLVVDLHFTGRVEHGPVQLARRQLLDQLRELRRLSNGAIRLVEYDPAASASARLETERYGIVGVPFRSGKGDAALTQVVHLGLVMRYRGREAVVPFVLPQRLEFLFFEALGELLSERRRAIGWYAPGSAAADFQGLRDLLGQKADVLDATGLAEGLEVPAASDALVVPRPEALHPRALWAIDRYLQRGGRVLVLLDRSRVDPLARTAEPIASGLDSYLQALGIRQQAGWVFERASPGTVRLRGPGDRPVEQPYPYFVRLGPERFDPSEPLAQGLAGAEFLWAHGFELGEPPPDLSVTVLARSSERSYGGPLPRNLNFDGEALRRAESELVLLAEPKALPLVVALGGPWPSPLQAAPPPPRRDPLGGPDLPGGEAPELGERGRGRLVLVGDADWATARGLGDGALAAWVAENRMLAERLVDWLTLDETLLALRTRIPKERRIRDFVAEELEAADISAIQRALAQGGTSPAEQAARARAQVRQWVVTASASLGSMGGVLLLWVAARLRKRAGWWQAPFPQDARP